MRAAEGLAEAADREDRLGASPAAGRRRGARPCCSSCSDGAEQLAGVGVLRGVEDLVDRPLLDDLAVVHHRDLVGDLGDDAHVVGDEHHRHAVARPAAA